MSAMDVFDKLAFLGRKYELARVPGSGSTRFTMGDVLQMFNQAAILELTPSTGASAGQTLRPDPVRKIKVSLLDNGFSAIHSDNTDWYEVYRTPPSGDLTKVRIVAYAPDGTKVGELKILTGRRSFEHYFEHDPIFAAIEERNA
jgi:hypothetical protein